MKPGIVLDIETIPRPLAELEKLMPPEMLNPAMPPEIEHPPEPDFEGRCPDYGFKAASEKVRDLENANMTDGGPRDLALSKAYEKQREAAAKREKWTSAACIKWELETGTLRGKWLADTKAAKAKFIDRAALDPARGQVKLIGVRVHGYGVPLAPVVFAWEPDTKINAQLQAQAGRDGHGYNGFLLEKQAIAAAFKYVEEQVRPKDTKTGRPGRKARARILTFFGNTFDLPFLARRGAITGITSWFNFLRRWRRGRYLDGEVFVDLCEEWKLADRSADTGGLEALAALLGYAGHPKGDGANFWQFYQQDPEEGVAYLLNDLARTAHVGKALGFIQ